MTCPLCGQPHTTITCPGTVQFWYPDNNGTAVPSFHPFTASVQNWKLALNPSTIIDTSPFTTKGVVFKKNEYSEENLNKWK